MSCRQSVFPILFAGNEEAQMCLSKINLTLFKSLSWLLLLLLAGCGPSSFRVDPASNPNIEVIISYEENGGGILSPEGDKLVYETSQPSGLFLLNTQTQQKYELDNNSCDFAQWLDNNILSCWINMNPTSIVVTDDNLRKISLQQVDEKETDVQALLEDKVIYQLSDKPAFIALHQDYKDHPDENYYVTVKDVDEVLQGHTSITLPVRGPVIQLGEKLYSHNKEYYFAKRTSYSAAIYNAATDKKLAEFNERDPNAIHFLGWAADNSGVYFMVVPGGMLNNPRHGLFKLNVPSSTTFDSSALLRSISIDTSG
jgi:hypothetical protein